MNQKYSTKDKENVISHYLNGTSVSQLTTDTGIPKSTIYRWIKGAQMEKADDDDCTPTNYYMVELLGTNSGENGE